MSETSSQIQFHVDRGDYRQAFNALVDEQQAYLLKVIVRLVGDMDEAMDVLQDTYVKIWNKMESFQGNSKWSTWTYRIATNEALMHLRKKKKWHTTSDPAVADALVGSSYFNGDEVIAALYQALDTLPAKQRLVFQMRYFDEIPYAEMEEITGTSQGALKASYHHAVKKIESEVVQFKLLAEKNIKGEV